MPDAVGYLSIPIASSYVCDLATGVLPLMLRHAGLSIKKISNHVSYFDSVE